MEFIQIINWQIQDKEWLKDWYYRRLWDIRTNKQNRLYFSYLKDLVKCFDEKWIFITKQDLHEWLKNKLIQWIEDINILTWEKIIIRKTTTELTRKEFIQYIKDIEKYCFESFEIVCSLKTDMLLFTWIQH